MGKFTHTPCQQALTLDFFIRDCLSEQGKDALEVLITYVSFPTGMVIIATALAQFSMLRSRFAKRKMPLILYQLLFFIRQ